MRTLINSTKASRAIATFAVLVLTLGVALSMTPVANAATFTRSDLTSAGSFTWSVSDEASGAKGSGTASQIIRNADGTISPIAVTISSSTEVAIPAGDYQANFTGSKDSTRGWTLHKKNADGTVTDATTVSGQVTAVKNASNEITDFRTTLVWADGTTTATHYDLALTALDTSGNKAYDVDLVVPVNGAVTSTTSSSASSPTKATGGSLAKTGVTVAVVAAVVVVLAVAGGAITVIVRRH